MADCDEMVLLPHLPLHWSPALLLFVVNYTKVEGKSDQGPGKRQLRSMAPLTVIRESDINLPSIPGIDLKGATSPAAAVHGRIQQLVQHKIPFNPVNHNIEKAQALFQVVINLIKVWLEQFCGDNYPHLDLDGLSLAKMLPKENGCAHLKHQAKNDCDAVTKCGNFEHPSPQVEGIPQLISDYNRLVESLVKYNPSIYQLIELHKVQRFTQLFKQLPSQFQLVTNKEMPEAIVNPLFRSGPQDEHQRLWAAAPGSYPADLFNDNTNLFVIPIVSLVHPHWRNPVFLRLSATSKLMREGGEDTRAFIYQCRGYAYAMTDDMTDGTTELQCIIESRIAHLDHDVMARVLGMQKFIKKDIEEYIEERTQGSSLVRAYNYGMKHRHDSFCGGCHILGHKIAQCPFEMDCGTLNDASIFIMLLRADAEAHSAGSGTLQSAWNMIDALALLELMWSYHIEAEREPNLGGAKKDECREDVAVYDPKTHKVVKGKSNIEYLVALYNEHVRRFWGGGRNPCVAVTGEPCAFAKYPAADADLGAVASGKEFNCEEKGNCSERCALLVAPGHPALITQDAMECDDHDSN